MSLARDCRDGKQLHGEQPWFDRVLIVWMEDDATMGLSDHETVDKAFLRLSGRKKVPADRIGVIDHGDAFVELYPSGWVACHSPCGGYVGIVYRVVREMGC